METDATANIIWRDLAYDMRTVLSIHPCQGSFTHPLQLAGYFIDVMTNDPATSSRVWNQCCAEHQHPHCTRFRTTAMHDLLWKPVRYVLDHGSAFGASPFEAHRRLPVILLKISVSVLTTGVVEDERSRFVMLPIVDKPVEKELLLLGLLRCEEHLRENNACLIPALDVLARAGTDFSCADDLPLRTAARVLHGCRQSYGVKSMPSSTVQFVMAARDKTQGFPHDVFVPLLIARDVLCDHDVYRSKENDAALDSWLCLHLAEEVFLAMFTRPSYELSAVNECLDVIRDCLQQCPAATMRRVMTKQSFSRVVAERTSRDPDYAEKLHLMSACVDFYADVA